MTGIVGSEREDRGLEALLVALDPELVEGAFVFVSVPQGRSVEGAVAMVHEAEGTTYVLRRSDADRQGLVYDFVASWITLRVQSSLDAVGLTTAVSTALSKAGISCNVLAGVHHDHLLVPAQRRAESLEILRGLALPAVRSE